MNHCFVPFDPFNQNHNPAWGLRIPFQKPIDRPINRTAFFFERKRLRGEESLKAWWRGEGNELKEGQPGGETVIKITVGRAWVMTSSFASNHRSLINYLLLNYSSLNIPFMSAFHVLVREIELLLHENEAHVGKEFLRNGTQFLDVKVGRILSIFLFDFDQIDSSGMQVEMGLGFNLN